MIRPTALWKASNCIVLVVTFLLCLSRANGGPWPCSDEQMVHSTSSFHSKVVLVGNPLSYINPDPILIQHPCIEYYLEDKPPAIYLGEKVFLSLDGFGSSLLPLTIPNVLVPSPAVVSSAVFVVNSRLLFVINGKVYIYFYTIGQGWMMPKGIDRPVTEITNIDCCYAADDPRCNRTSETVIAYNTGNPAYYSSVFFSKDGGYTFTMVTVIGDGNVIGIYNFVSLSQLALLLNKTRDDKKNAYFSYGGAAYMESRKGAPFCLEPCENETVVSLIPPGLRGFIVLWTKDSFMFSFNNGLTTDRITVHPTANYTNKTLPMHGKGLCNVAVGKTEIAALTKNLKLFYGTLDIVSTQMVFIAEKESGTDTRCDALVFEKTGMLTILQPVPSTGTSFYSFQKCIINIQSRLMKLRPPLKPCPVEILSGDFHNKMYYIDMKEKLYFNVTFVPKPGTGAFPYVTVSNPHVLAFQARLMQDGYTYDGNTKYNLQITMLQQQFTDMAHAKFQDDFYEGRLSTITVDIYNKGIFCIDMHPLTALIAIDCPPTKHIRLYKNITACTKGLFYQYVLHTNFTYKIPRKEYDPKFLNRIDLSQGDLNVSYNYELLGCPILLYYDSPWLPVFELWEDNEFVEFVSADFVLFEINGKHTYDYVLTETGANCISRPQNWVTAIKNDVEGDPHHAWNRYNYESCKEHGGNDSLPSDSRKYQVLNINEKNGIQFQQYNGMYIFKATVVDTLYSYCELTTTFSVYVYGAIPPSEINPGKTLTSFLVLIFGTILAVYYFPKLLKENAKMKSLWT
ncbi:cation channel sperm-associated auxiliary subunit delta [Hemicordylus capensis]|uniref:cation channel sperm-associated auxiliary subunit delta n=1 Tax=Hemicordylus capensis TaxID=884348 RepID=UPI00230450CF|nr:cation channel sperm-associated auxiliary subunit delta [Hemicordylus capensis]